MPTLYKRNCDYCGKRYEKPAKYFCSLKCSFEYSSKHPNKGCFQKGHSLNLKPSIFRNCLYCNKLFEVDKRNIKTKHCSHICSVNNILKGRKLTEEHKRKIKENHSRYWSNHEMSKKHIKKLIKASKPYQSGKNHPNWKGGITPILKKLRCVRKYKLWREAVFKRDNYTCRKCFIRGGKINADHIIPFAKLVYEKNWKLLWNIDNGRTLCKPCHGEIDTYARRFYRKDVMRNATI